MDKNRIQNQDEIIRQMMQSTKMQASENLKHRIMHQIETENALVPKKAKSKKRKSETVLRDFIGIFGVMYAVLALIFGGAYLLKGKDFLLSTHFIGTMGVVVFAFVLFWLITRLDERMREKLEGKSRT